jgi:hypothetical protein
MNGVRTTLVMIGQIVVKLPYDHDHEPFSVILKTFYAIYQELLTLRDHLVHSWIFWPGLCCSSF